MKVVITGRKGQVAKTLNMVLGRAPEYELVFLQRPDFELADVASVEKQIRMHAPDLVISAAAYTDVDGAEEKEELAFAINATGAGAVAKAAQKCGAPIIHLSTDYVFDGKTGGAYVEGDVPKPQSAYGRTKLAGEQLVAAQNSCHIILRTAGVYSPFGKNFVKTMLQFAQARKQVCVVSDQIGNPTSAIEIAKAVLVVLETIKQPDFKAHGVYHFAGKETMSWAEFARAIFQESAALGGPVCSVKEIKTFEFPTKATRPQNSAMDCGMFERMFDVVPASTSEALRICISAILNGDHCREDPAVTLDL